MQAAASFPPSAAPLAAMHPVPAAALPDMPTTSAQHPQIVIRRLEVETELRRRQMRRAPRAWQPPALDISMAKRDVAHLEGNKTPQEFLCPMSMQLMTDPVVTPTGVTYDRCAARSAHGAQVFR